MRRVLVPLTTCDSEIGMVIDRGEFTVWSRNGHGTDVGERVPFNE